MEIQAPYSGPSAHSSGRILELTRAQRASSGERRKKLHQFLSEIGIKALRQMDL